MANIPNEWTKLLNDILCKLKGTDADICHLQKDCQTVTSLSDFVQDGSNVSIIFTDEKVLPYDRQLQLEIIINHLFDNVASECIMTKEDWLNATFGEKFQAVIDDVCTCCDTTTTTTTTSTTSTTTAAPVACGDEVVFAGGEDFPFVQPIILGGDLGIVTLDFNTFDIPDKMVVFFDGIEVINTGYRGDTSYQTALTDELIARGYTPETIVSPGLDSAFFNKTTATDTAYVYIYAPLPDTGWTFTLSCPPEVTTTSTTTTTTEEVTTTTTTTTETSTTTTTTVAPTVMITNSLPGTSITSVSNVPGFNLFLPVGVGESASGFHNAFTGTVQIVVDGPPIFNGNAALEKNGILVDCVNLTTGGVYPATITFTSQTFFLGDTLHASVNIGTC